MPRDTSIQLRTDFFDWLFGEKDGYICLAWADAVNPRQSFKQKFFHWPSEKEAVHEHIDRHKRTRNLWYGVNILAAPERLKHQCISHDVVWSDLDTADPDIVLPKPNMVIESSPGHYQAIWKLDQEIPPDVAEDYSKRIAYKYRKDGADPTGWDLTQLLRVPFTKNLKYKTQPTIQILPNLNKKATAIEDLEALENAPVDEADIAADHDMPAVDALPNVENIIYKYQPYLEKSFFELAQIEPSHSDDWSARMWKLLNLGFEAGMEPEEVFAVAQEAKCNKYFRDGRPIRFLWREVLKAYEIQKRINVVTNNVQPLTMPQLVNEDECEFDTFIDTYKQWATGATDAVPVFHELCAAILLSASLASNIRLEATYGQVVPNLWGMILGASTIDRKTTAMEMAKGILWEVDQDAILATDGSVEGLLQGLSLRPNRVSMFHRDEVSGFFKAIGKKDYLADMPQTLAHLYDAPKFSKRMLRHESIEIREPVFIFFAGGIKEEVYANLSNDYVTNGFLPRFLVVIGEQDITKIKPTGAKTDEGIAARERIISDLRSIKQAFGGSPSMGTIKVGGQEIALADIEGFNRIDATLTDDSWKLYQKIEVDMAAAAYGSYYKDLALPTFERLSRSLLRLAMLIGAARQEPQDGEYTVEVRDIKNAARFIQKWGRDSIELMLNAGTTSTLRQMEKIRRYIDNKPGISRSELMRISHMTSREMTEVLATLADRGEVRRTRQSKTEQWWIVH